MSYEYEINRLVKFNRNYRVEHGARYISHLEIDYSALGSYLDQQYKAITKCVPIRLQNRPWRYLIAPFYIKTAMYMEQLNTARHLALEKGY